MNSTTNNCDIPIDVVVPSNTFLPAPYPSPIVQQKEEEAL